MKKFVKNAVIFCLAWILGFFMVGILINNVRAQDLTQNQSQDLVSQQISVQLNRLALIQAELNNNIFNSPVFKSLKDFSEPLPVEDKGRINPFAPPGF